MCNAFMQPVSKSRLSRNLLLAGFALVAIAFATLTTAQTFDSGSDGSDGALDLTGETGTLVFDPAAFNPPLDPDGDHIYHFTTITIPTGLNLKLSAAILGAIPVVWLASGDVQLDGSIDLNGESGFPTSPARKSAIAGAGGFGGGLGSAGGLPATPGFGPGGGTPCVDGDPAQTFWHGGGGGHTNNGINGAFCVTGGTGGAAYGNPFLLPLIGGSGGAGSTSVDGSPSFRGGAGGGALLIASSTKILFGSAGADGEGIYADGGICESFYASSRGGGSGGAIRLIAPHIGGQVKYIVARGSSGGSKGRFRIEAFEYTLTETGYFDPYPTISTPFPGTIFPPDSVPKIRVVSINGIPVPDSPTGNFILPDVVINTFDPVTVVVEGRNVPMDKIVQLDIMPENTALQTVYTGPLTGTLEQSTASAEVTFEHGFSRIFIQASIK